MVLTLESVASAWQEGRWLSLVVPPLIVAVLTSLAFVYISYTPTFPSNAPKRVSSREWPIIGSFQFFTRRADFFLEAVRASPTGHFSFQVGRHHVVGVSGHEARRKVLESRELSFADGYGALFSGAPVSAEDRPVDQESSFSKHINSRIVQMMRRDAVHNVLPHLVGDTKTRLVELAQAQDKITDPFESVYRIVFQLTMRTVGCNEIAEDDVRRDKMLDLFERIEASNTPWLIMFPWLPIPAKFKRLAAAAQIWSMMRVVINDREKTGRREEDALQMQLDHGDDTWMIIATIISSLFAGQLNSGINAAWLLVYLADQPQWQTKIREELRQTCDKHVEDKSAPLLDQLCSLSMEAWEGALPTLDNCLKDSIRLQEFGSIFRRNNGKDMQIGNEVIPHGAFIAYHVDDVHSNPDIYPDPERWDPSRYERGEDKKAPYGFMGWGAGRHPCLGMRFAKLEMIIIVGMFLAAFDFDLSDKNGGPGTLPKLNRNNVAAAKPDERVYLKYRVRQGAF